MEAIRSTGNFDVFDIPLILCHLPKDFRFDSNPEFKFMGVGCSSQPSSNIMKPECIWENCIDHR